MSKCVVCGSSDIKVAVSYDKYPFCIGVIPLDLQKKIKSQPLKIGVCQNCDHIQQIDPVAIEYLENMYSDEYSELLSSVPTPSKNEIGRREAKRCFDFFLKCKLPKGKIMDIGCYDGYFLSLVKTAGYDVLGVEPNPISQVAEEEYQIPIRREFFSSKSFGKNSFDIVIMRNLLEHIIDLNGFLDQVNHVLKPEGHVFIEVPNMPYHLKQATLNCFFHQHHSYFSLDVLLYSLSKHGFVQTRSEGEYALYLCAQKAKTPIKQLEPTGSGRKEEVANYFSVLEKTRLALRKILQNEEHVAVFGAGGHTAGLLQLLGDDYLKKFKYVYDNNPMKQGLVVADIPIKVKSPEAIKNDNPNIIVVSSALHQTAMLAQLKNMKLPRIKIVAIYPEVKIIN